MTPSPPPGSLRSFAAENGAYLTAHRLLTNAPRRLRDLLLARRLHAPGLRLGARPKLSGLAHMRLGRDLAAGRDLWLEAVTHFNGHTYSPLLSIGDHCNFSDAVHIACTHRVSIGPGLLCGSRVLITDHAHGLYAGSTPVNPPANSQADLQTDPSLRPSLRPLSSTGTVRIGANVWIGDGVAILPGAEIGDGVILGANAVVTGVIPANTIAVGIPARPLRQWNPAAARWLPFPSPVSAHPHPPDPA